jgi:mannose-6-phosphate isomerase-like protein (cupin superfamily)
MADKYKVLNFEDVEDQAPKFGMSPGLDSRFARKPLELEKSGISRFKIAPLFRTPFGHSHSEQEEIYVVTSGSARVKLDDEIIELREWDIVRVGPGVMRGIEGGPDGAEVLAYGAPNTENGDFEMVPGWWED